MRSGGWSREPWVLVLVVSLLAPGLARAEGVSVEAHVTALGSLDPAQRIAAARALGEARAVVAVEPLARVLRTDPSPEVRGWVVRALAQIGTAEARAALAQAAQSDADERVRRLAIQTSGQVTQSPFEPERPAVYSRGPRRGLPLPGPGVRPRRRGLGMLVAGWTVFGTSYLISMIAGAVSLSAGSDYAWTLFIPAIGPVVEAGLMLSDDYYGDTEGLLAPVAVLLIIDSLAQIAGLSLGTVGLIRFRRGRAEAGGGGTPDQDAAPAQPSARSWGLVLAPAGLAGWF